MDFWCEIYKDKLLENIQKIKKIDNKKIMAVVKANAYGLGLNKIVSIIEDKVDFFVVQTMEEARKIDTKKEVLILSPICEIDDTLGDNFIFTIDSEEDLKKFNHTRKYKVHIYVNTGMNRSGIEPHDFDNIFNKISTKYPNITVDGVYTHLHNCSDIGCTKKQIKLFKSTIENYIDKIPNIHCLNSKAFLNKDIREEADFTNMIRIGNLLYGYDGVSMGFQKVFNIKAKVKKTYKINNSGYIGYGNKFKVKKNTTVGVIPCGIIDKIGYTRDIKNSLIIDFLKFIKHKIIKTPFAYYNEKPINLLCTPNMGCTLVDLSKIKEDKEIILNINTNSIQVDSSIHKIYI